MSAEREGSSSRALESGRTVPALGLLLASLAIVGTIAGPFSGPLNPAQAADATGGSSDALIVSAAPALSGLVREGQNLSIRVTISNPSSNATPALSVQLSVAGSSPADANELSTWFIEGSSELTLTPAIDGRVDALEPGASAVLDLAVPSDAAGLSGPFGARLASVLVTGDGVDLAASHTALVWVPDATAPPAVPTTFVLPLVTPREADGFLSAEILARYTAPSGSLTRTLDAVAGRAVVLAIDPRIIASIRLLGDAAPPSATLFLERLATVSNETFLLPWADADPVATVSATGITLPLPEGAGLPSTPTAETGDAAGTSPSPTPTPGPDGEPALAELAAWPTTFDGWIWPEQGTLTLEAVTAISAEQPDAAILTPDDAASGVGLQRRVGETELVIYDAALAIAAREAVQAGSQQRFDAALARVAALLAAQNPGDGPSVIALGRDRLGGTVRLAELLGRVIALPWSQGTGLSAAMQAPHGDVGTALVDAPADEIRNAEVTAALEAEQADRDFAQITADPSTITDRRRLELLAALSLGWAENSDSALRSFIVDSTTLRASVQIAESSAITLLTDRASLPITVRNDLDVAVEVYVRVEPDSGQLRVLDQRVVTVVEPRSQTRALVPVESLTNGEVDITVTIRSSDGRVIGEPTRVSLNLQAGWETAGTVAFGVLIVVLFAVGLFRDIRRRRRPVSAVVQGAE